MKLKLCIFFFWKQVSTRQPLEEELNKGRNDLEFTTDYPGSGANNHHTPTLPPAGKA